MALETVRGRYGRLAHARDWLRRSLEAAREYIHTALRPRVLDQRLPLAAHRLGGNLHCRIALQQIRSQLAVAAE